MRLPSDMDGLTFFRSAARGLHAPTELTRESTKREPRKRRANERPRVGCCEELARRDVRQLLVQLYQILMSGIAVLDERQDGPALNKAQRTFIGFPHRQRHVCY
jgi:hypothetical protein